MQDHLLYYCDAFQAVLATKSWKIQITKINELENTHASRALQFIHKGQSE